MLSGLADGYLQDKEPNQLKKSTNI